MVITMGKKDNKETNNLRRKKNKKKGKEPKRKITAMGIAKVITFLFFGGAFILLAAKVFGMERQITDLMVKMATVPEKAVETVANVATTVADVAPEAMGHAAEFITENPPTIH